MGSKIQSFTPREIVSELDRYIVGQKEAKKAVAIALRNRWRRQQVSPQLREEISPKNIILMGPTGCGKTEIARRLAKLAQAPFVKVEATKFTEVGYVGRDVESMVRDLVDVSVKMCKEEAMQFVKEKARGLAEEHILDLLLPSPNKNQGARLHIDNFQEPAVQEPAHIEEETREKLRLMLREGKLNDKEVNVEVSQSGGMPMMHMFGQGVGVEEMASNLQDALQNALGSRKKRRKMKVPEALELLIQEEAHKLIDTDQVNKNAITRAQESGIVFIDEIDKVASAGGGGRGPDVSREGVQRDILPIVEGCNVSTKYGVVNTDHILFIAAGAFHISKPSDLIPELQGRFPIRVELESLKEEDFVRILQEPENSLVKQYSSLMATEEVSLDFTLDGLHAIAKVAATVNSTQENIGARRLYTVMERLLEEESFHAPDQRGKKVVVDESLVASRLSPILQNEDLSKFIL